MKIHIQNIGECGKCSDALTSFLSNQQKYGLRLTDKPKDCNFLIIVGCLSKTQIEPLTDFWKNLPKNHKILSFGDCGTEDQELFTFKEQKLKNQAIPKDDLAEILPIDDIIKGCPPTLNEINNFFKNIKK